MFSTYAIVSILMRVWWGHGTTKDPKKHRVALVAGQVASGLGNMAIEMGTLKAGNGFILPSGYLT